MNHTPGQWILKKQGDYYRITDEDGNFIVDLSGFWFPSEEQIETYQANARLIANAPELLKSLEEALAFTCGMCSVNEPPLIKCSGCADTNPWRDAIAKAKE